MQAYVAKVATDEEHLANLKPKDLNAEMYLIYAHAYHRPSAIANWKTLVMDADDQVFTASTAP